MTKFKEYSSLDGLALADLVKRRAISPSEILAAALSAVERLNPELNAVTLLFRDHAGRSIADGLPEGPFEGVPFLLKDIGGAFLEGEICSSSSRLLAETVSDHDSEIVARYKRSGAVIFGRTNMPNFGTAVTTESRFRGPVRNPWDPTRMTGGSSGGAAAAVASGMVPMAHATDAAGSLRVPASHCGLFGLKTSRGRISASPDLGELAGGLGSHHVVSRTVRDSAAMLDATAGAASGDPYTAPFPERPFLEEIGRAPGTLRVAFSTTAPNRAAVDGACVAAVENAASLCAELGHIVEEGEPTFSFEEMARHFPLVHGAHWARAILGHREALGREPEPEEIEGSVLAWARHCAGKSALDYAESVRTIHRLGRQIAAFFEGYDLFMCPVAAQPPLPLGTLDASESDLDRYLTAMWEHMAFTTQFNCSGQPAMSVPLHWTGDGLPVGVQFVGRFGAEATLFQLAGQLERAKPWQHRRPPLFAD